MSGAIDKPVETFAHIFRAITESTTVKGHDAHKVMQEEMLPLSPEQARLAYGYLNSGAMDMVIERLMGVALLSRPRARAAILAFLEADSSTAQHKQRLHTLLNPKEQEHE